MASSNKNFDDFRFNKQLLQAIEEAGYEQPSPIQKRIIPLIEGGQDVIGIAPTGTGKTAAFVWPLLMKLRYPEGNDPRAVILGPTKELVIQLSENIGKYAKYTGLRHATLYGGVGTKQQIEAINNGVDIIVATPGRFLDIYQRENFVTKKIKTLILDEADRLMDMGFMPQIKKIQEALTAKKQNMLFSATFPDKVALLSEEFMDFPEKVAIAPQASVADTIQQLAYRVPNFMTKIHLLSHLYEHEMSFEKVLIFVNTKSTANNIFHYIGRKIPGGVRVIHSNKGQNVRINAIKDFENGEIKTLVATDVSARGIDIEGVSHVINFEIPRQYEEYVHRIGRTGRAGKKGIAISFANKAEEMHIARIEKLTNSRVSWFSLPGEVTSPTTPKEEVIAIERSIDAIKRRENPDYKGAFHAKKKKNDHKKPKKR